MLIYEKKEDGYYCTQVILGFTKSECVTHKVKQKEIHNEHFKTVRLLSTDETMVFVTGDTSVLGGGVQARYKYERYL